ncbi:MAG TPA: hypothetical protein VFT87_02995 [Candidatus Saccharimonadales bacterium]|nr:hypothetical protein [Candidatus Saccharimonadales bacterium]
MRISKESIVFGVMGLLAGSLLTLLVTTVVINNHHQNMMQDGSMSSMHGGM